jgi:hypothetical protein
MAGVLDPGVRDADIGLHPNRCIVSDGQHAATGLRIRESELIPQLLTHFSDNLRKNVEMCSLCRLQ